MQNPILALLPHDEHFVPNHSHIHSLLQMVLNLLVSKDMALMHCKILSTIRFQFITSLIIPIKYKAVKLL